MTLIVMMNLAAWIGEDAMRDEPLTAALLATSPNEFHLL